ncbi:MAG: YdcF family protein [Anaerolineae bacterium]|nr:YdcF family protein [Anaerolineae bacterium]
MDIFLSKFLPLLVYPLGLACFLVLLTLFIKKQQRLRNVVLIAALLLLWVGGNRWFSYALARSLEWQNLPAAELPHADVIVVLGGGTQPAEYPRPMVEVNSAGDRVLYAAKLYEQGLAPHILLSGGNITWMADSSTSTPASEMADILALTRVPADAIWLENKSLNTAENASFCKEILQAKGIRSIILVTSAMHMPRAKALFERQGLQVIPAPVDFTITQAGWDSATQLNIPNQIINFFPNASSLSLTTNVLKEYFGIIVYGLDEAVLP